MAAEPRGLRRILGWVPAVLVVVAVGCARSPSTKTSPVPPAPKTARPLGGPPGKPIPWGADYEKAVEQARVAGKPLMADVSTSWCSACKRLDADVFSRGDVVEASEAFVCVRVDGDKRADLVKKFKVSGYPTVVFLGQEGKELGRVRGAVPYQVMLEEMRKLAGQTKTAKPG